MTNQELIINGKRINLGKNFGVRLNRQLLNPAELNTKDAQFSYSITFPTGGVNDVALNYSNIEETRDKFNRLYAASYTVNGVRIFVGNFKLTNVSATAYKGNLYVPAPKSIKDIFGEIKLNQNPELRIPFEDFATSVNGYNTAAATEPQYAIFPYTLYGVLPKSPLNKNANTYSARDLWDASVRLGIQDLPPSINPLLMLKHIFNAQGYSLQGTAFDDARLASLYLSYKNADDYVQPWNYGQFAKIHVRGGWSSRYNFRSGGEQLERGVNQGADSTGVVYACDIFDATNTSMEIVQDTGGNVLYNEVNDGDGRTYVQAQVRIPTSGFYKVRFNASLRVYDSEDYRMTDPATGVQHVGGRTPNAVNDFNDNIYEIRLCRDRKTGDFGLNSPRLNGLFYYDNQPQNQVFDGNNVPKHFPQALGDGQTNFIDLAQDRAHLLGFNYGRHAPVTRSVFPNPPTVEPANPDFYNPKAGLAPNVQMLVAKPALSWDASESTENPTRLAVKSVGYWKYGRIGDFDNEGDNPNIDLDYSGATKALAKIIDAQGNPANPSGGDFDTQIPDYYLSILTGFQTFDVDYKVTDFIEMAGFTNLRFTLDVDGTADIAVLAFYDINLQFIGAGITTIGATSYTDEPVVAPAGAAYFRLTADEDSDILILADNINNNNIILERFQLARFYTYRIETDPADNYQGYAYVHNGANIDYTFRVEFVDGVAEFDTTLAPLAVFDPKLTLYLKTPDFDVDGTLTISRRIEGDSQDVIDWELTDKYKIDLNDAPANYARRGSFNGGGGLDVNWYAQGETNAVVWLEAGELLTVASVTSEGRYRGNGMHATFGWATHEVLYDLDVQPFRTDPEWLKVSLQGNGTAVMSWNDAPNFENDSINLVGFLSADLKTDEFIDNFCKAFNLRLSQTGINSYSLDLKQTKTAVSSRFINLDKIASVKDRENTPLGLPSLYRLGFTIDTEEQGYVESGDNGGGEYETGSVDGNIVEQKSTFSYNWFKNITKVETAGNVTIPLAIISKSDVWVPSLPYPEAMKKHYSDLAYRFWYYDGLLTSGGATFNFNGAPLQIARVSNQIEGVSILNYKNVPHTILDNYFTVLINGSSHYTELEGYPTETMYAQLDGSIMAMFNGDLYFIAELGAYDPTNKNKTNIKLIRKL